RGSAVALRVRPRAQSPARATRPLEREQGRLHRGPLALTLEIGAKTGAQVARPADVEHLPVAVAKEVDAGPGGCAAGEGTLVIDLASSRGGERTQVGEPPRSSLLGQPDQVHQHLRGRLGIRKGAVAGPGRNAEEVGERGKADST